MTIASSAASILFVLAVLAALIGSDLNKQPGLGIIITVIMIALSLWLRGMPLISIGFGPPTSWGTTILLALVLGIVLQLLSVAFIEPLTERFTRSKHNHAILANVKGIGKFFYSVC
jgi:hypothetical protein